MRREPARLAAHVRYQRYQIKAKGRRLGNWREKKRPAVYYN